MKTEYFFIYEALIEEKRLDIGFSLYEAGHFVWLAFILAAGVLISGIYKRKSAVTRGKVKKFFASVITAGEILKDGILIICGAPMIDYLPFHLCSFAIFCMLADAFGKPKAITKQLIAYAFFPGAAAALLFCNWTMYPFFSFMNIYSFLFHGWIATYFLMLYRGGEIRLSYSGIWKSAAIIFSIAVPVYIFNLIFGTNYLFLNEAQEGSPLVIIWEIFGVRFGQAGYLAGVCLMALILFHILCAVYSAVSSIRKYKER